jgi:hypothetical protein
MWAIRQPATVRREMNITEAVHLYRANSCCVSSLLFCEKVLASNSDDISIHFGLVFT